MEINVDQSRIDELVKGEIKWYHPTKFIQDAFPDLTADEREFIMTGITPEEWENLTWEELNDEELD